MAEVTFRHNDEFMEYTDTNGFRVNIWDGACCVMLCDVTGKGETFFVPPGVTCIAGIDTEYLDKDTRCTTFDTPNLKAVYIPDSVVTIEAACFDDFDNRLHIYCAAKEKPAGYFAGVYYEQFQEDYEFYDGSAYTGSWLTAGTLRGESIQEDRLPQVHWGAEF